MIDPRSIGWDTEVKHISHLHGTCYCRWQEGGFWVPRGRVEGDRTASGGWLHPSCTAAVPCMIVVACCAQLTRVCLCLQVARVGVHSGQLLEMQQLSRSWLLGQCAQQQVDVNHTSRLLRLLTSHLQSLPEGKYLLTHQPGAAAVCCFRAQDEPGVMQEAVSVLTML